MESIEEMCFIIEQQGLDIFHGTGAGFGSRIPDFCDLLCNTLSTVTLLPNPATESQVIPILKNQIPKAIEILCKRKTKLLVRSHEFEY